MTFKTFLDDAFVKGRNLKEEVLSDLLSSKVLNQMMSTDIFATAVARAMRTKHDIAKILRKNIKNVFEIMDVPSRGEIKSLLSKIDQLEKSVDRIGKKAITVKSLKTIQKRKAK